MDPEGGVAPPQIDGQPLKKVSSGLGGGNSQSEALKPSNDLDGESCLLTPTSQGLHHHGDEGYSHSVASFGVGRLLPFLSHREGVALSDSDVARSFMHRP